RGLGGTWSSGRQALGRHDVAAYASTHTPPYSKESYSPGVRTEYKAELALLGHEVAELDLPSAAPLRRAHAGGRARRSRGYAPARLAGRAGGADLRSRPPRRGPRAVRPPRRGGDLR